MTTKPFTILAAFALTSVVGVAQAVDLGEARRAHESILRLDLDDARKALESAELDDPRLHRERILLAVYEGDCDRAVSMLGNERGNHDDPLGGVAEVARGCARVTAATTVVTDEARGIVLRVKDDEDLPLVPFISEVAAQALAAVERDLGVALPRPLRIDIVRDHFTLAAMTGLPEEAAQTTGTVAVAKWGRVTMVTPRVAPHGYPWADTLMHELTHLAVTRASVDRAPLWLQEGVAKREETRWRNPSRFDDVPTPEAIARAGFDKGLARDLDRLGPSIAMLPTAEQAMIAFAEVHSFVRFFVHEQGDSALGKLLFGLGEAMESDPVDPTLSRVSGATLSAWSERWKRSLSNVSPNLPPDFMLGSHGSVDMRELARAARLGDLLAERNHHQEALRYLKKTHEILPREPAIRAKLGVSLRALGQKEEMAKAIGTLEDVSSPYGDHLALRGAVLREKGDNSAAIEAFYDALLASPFDQDVACEALEPAARPDRPERAALCDAVRKTLRR
jgi:hypothetical protein